MIIEYPKPKTKDSIYLKIYYENLGQLLQKSLRNSPIKKQLASEWIEEIQKELNMATKIVCDKCGDDVGKSRYRFKAIIEHHVGVANVAPAALNASIPGCDLCVNCHGDILTVLRNLNLPTIATTQT